MKNIGAEHMSDMMFVAGIFFLKSITATTEADDQLITEIATNLTMSASTIRRIPQELAAATFDQLRAIVADMYYLFALDDHGNWGNGAHLVTDFCGWRTLLQAPVIVHVSNSIIGHSGVSGAANIVHWAIELNALEKVRGQVTDSTASAILSQAREVRKLLRDKLTGGATFYLSAGCTHHVHSKVYETGYLQTFGTSDLGQVSALGLVRTMRKLQSENGEQERRICAKADADKRPELKELLGINSLLINCAHKLYAHYL